MTQGPQETGGRPLYAGLETGGAKWVCAIGTAPDHLRTCTQFATTTPSETMARASQDKGVTFVPRFCIKALRFRPFQGYPWSWTYIWLACSPCSTCETVGARSVINWTRSLENTRSRVQSIMTRHFFSSRGNLLK